MAIENWAKYPSAPPQEYDVLDRLTIGKLDSGRVEEATIVRGDFPYGFTVDGWQGKECLIYRRIDPQTGYYEIKRLPPSEAKFLLRSFENPQR